MSDDPFTEAEQLGTRLIDATHAAREAIKDVRAAVAEARQAAADLRSAAQKALDEGISEQVDKGLAEYKATVESAMDSATARVFRKFDDLAAILLGTDRQARARGETAIPDLIKRRAEP